MPLRLNVNVKNLGERLLKIVPLSIILFVLSYWSAKQIVTPHHRMIKMGVLGTVLLFMFRLDMIYSVFLFTVLFPFPSGITIGSTNSILMTLIGLTWAIRAASTGLRIHERTRYDTAIALLMLAYVVSFYSTETTRQIVLGINVVWKQFASLIFFYLIIRFVNDEKRLMRFTKVVGFVVALVAFTGLIELFFPGTTIIPGWIGLPEVKGKGSLTFRMEGLRLGGAVGGHNILSDIVMVGVLFLGFHTLRTRNPMERFLWLTALVGAIVVLFGTANRGAVISLGVGLIYALYRFSKRMSFVQTVVVVMVVVTAIVGIQIVLAEHTYAVSVFDRLLGTRFEGLEPDTREGIWSHTLNRSMERPFIGHGPYYDTGVGLEKQYWPHNAYLYYFYTIGIFGVFAFLWMSWMLVRDSMIYREKAVWGTPLGDLAMGLHVLICTLLFSQLRTDHQRDEVHIHLIWLVFGLVATTTKIVRARVREAREAAGSDSDSNGSQPSALT